MPTRTCHALLLVFAAAISVGCVESGSPATVAASDAAAPGPQDAGMCTIENMLRLSTVDPIDCGTVVAFICGVVTVDAGFPTMRGCVDGALDGGHAFQARWTVTDCLSTQHGAVSGRGGPGGARIDLYPPEPDAGSRGLLLMRQCDQFVPIPNCDVSADICLACTSDFGSRCIPGQ